MKTAIVWNEIEELKYAVVDGDLTKYHGIYANMCEPDGFEPAGKYDDIAEEMAEALDGVEFCSLDDFVEAIRAGANAIECGFLP